MRIGLAWNVHHRTDSDHDAELRGIGCERIFLINGDRPLKAEIEDTFKFLRAGDELAVADLTVLGASLVEVLEAVGRLGELGVALRIDSHEIVPGTPRGDGFQHACTVLLTLHQRLAEGSRPPAERARRRGRPSSLDPEGQKRAERMLASGDASVLEVARLLSVSPATIYRHFPRSKR